MTQKIDAARKKLFPKIINRVYYFLAIFDNALFAIITGIKPDRTMHSAGRQPVLASRPLQADM